MKKEIKLNKNQVPGYFRYILGKYEITSLYDGYVLINSDYYHRQDKEETIRQLKEGHANLVLKDGSLHTKLPLTIHLVNTGSDLILIDTGGGEGGQLGNTMGLSAKNLNLAGYDQSEVTKILLTHLHQDHIGGLVIDGEMMFPNATVYANQRELDFWLNEENKSELLDYTLKPYIENNKVKGIKGGYMEEGIKFVELLGHTPGHCGIEIESEGESILFWGDIIHDHEILLTNEDAALVFGDYNENKEVIEQEVNTRKLILQKVSGEKKLIGASHIPFPGIGHMVKNHGNYRWIPVQYMEI